MLKLLLFCVMYDWMAAFSIAFSHFLEFLDCVLLDDFNSNPCTLPVYMG